VLYFGPMLSRTTKPYLQLYCLILLTLSLSAAQAQNPRASRASKPDLQSFPAYVSPFDKLELTAFLAAGPYPPAAADAIRKRGLDFIPQDPFLVSYPSATIQRVLAHPRPIKPQPLPPNRQQALALLSKLAINIRDQRCAHAGENLQEALRLVPDSAGLHFDAAACAMSAQNWSQVEKESRESLRLWPGNADGHLLLAYALNNQGHSEDAVPEARTVLRIFPDHKGGIMQLGIALARSGKYAEAIPILKQSSILNQQATLVDKLLGYSFIETNQASHAVGPLTFYLQRVPTDAEAHYLLGTALRAMNEKEAARSQFEEALKLDPHNERFQAAVHPEAATPSSSQKPDLGSVSGNLYSNDFFEFTYEIPDGWTVLSTEAGRALVEVGGALISTGDPTEPETKKVALQRGYPLLTLMQGREKNQALAPRFVQIAALDAHGAPDMDTLSFQTAVMNRLKQSGAGFDPQEAPKNISLAGREFANSHFVAHVASGQLYSSQYVRKEKGFMLMITLSAPDPTSLATMESNLNSLHFLQKTD